MDMNVAAKFHIHGKHGFCAPADGCCDTDTVMGAPTPPRLLSDLVV